MLGAHADKAELRPLVYPVVQLGLGAARLVPTPRYFPLRLRLGRALNRCVLGAIRMKGIRLYCMTLRVRAPSQIRYGCGWRAHHTGQRTGEGDVRAEGRQE